MRLATLGLGLHAYIRVPHLDVLYLMKLGFKLSRVQKGVYVDGHEHIDVVDACKKLIAYMEKEVFP